MAAETTGNSQDLPQVLVELSELRRFGGAPKDFWPRLLAAIGALTGASHVSLLLRPAGEAAPWRRLGDWSIGASRLAAEFASRLELIGSQCVQDNIQLSRLDGGPGRGTGHYVIATRARVQRPEDVCVIACLLPESTDAGAREALLRLNLAADVPESYQGHQAAQAARADVEKFAGTIDLMAQVNAEKRFLAAALAFCNGLATRFQCDRVSLGWIEGGFARLRAISRTEKFDRQMAAAKALEVAMEEAADQDEEILWPKPESATFVARDHEKFSAGQEVAHLVSLPLRQEQKGVGVITCERQSGPFTAAEVQQMRLCCDQATRRLADLKQHDRWFGARAMTAVREQAARLLGPEHTWAKLIALLVVLALGVLFFVRVSYRVEGNFILRSDDVAFLTAPFEGYIRQVSGRPGDTVTNGSPLLALNTTELELEESSSLADLNRYVREAEKARAGNNLAEMRIAQALADQARARLDLVRYKIDQATVKAPFVGVVTEGDLRDRLGAPVKQGEALFKVARLDTLYVEAEVSERDVHEILGRTAGEIAFVSQPKLKYLVRIVRIEPAAFPKNEGNIFLVRCAFEGGPQPWWRPGMSGLCKLSVEKRTLWWILTHRTVDFLRMKLWW